MCSVWLSPLSVYKPVPAAKASTRQELGVVRRRLPLGQLELQHEEKILQRLPENVAAGNPSCLAILSSSRRIACRRLIATVSRMMYWISNYIARTCALDVIVRTARRSGPTHKSFKITDLRRCNDRRPCDLASHWR